MNLNDIRQKLGKSAGNMKFFVIISIVILFMISGLYVYRRSIAGKLNKKYVANNEFNQKNKKDVSSADIYMFYTEWCPHCKTAKPIWADFKNEMDGKIINGIKLNFFEVDCDKDTATADKYNVKGFPTIKLIKGNQIIEYDAKPSKENLIEFVNTSL